jgi:hypothetical protein
MLVLEEADSFRRIGCHPSSSGPELCAEFDSSVAALAQLDLPWMLGRASQKRLYLLIANVPACLFHVAGNPYPWSCRLDTAHCHRTFEDVKLASPSCTDSYFDFSPLALSTNVQGQSLA